MMFWKKKQETPATVTPEEKASWLQRLSGGLSQSSQKLTQGLVDAVTKRPLDQSALDELEESLIMADLGPQLAAKLVADFAKTRFGKEVTEQEVRQALAVQIEEILQPVAQSMVIDETIRPFVLLMVGVNGSGKTTTIGKLAQKFTGHGKKLVLAAGDTFRAAAVEQLQVWGNRTGATVIAKELNSDAAAVAFEAVQQAQIQQADMVMVDTAGRLHNKANLMEELAKIQRVLQKADLNAPHMTLLTLDATIGQNAIAQVEEFNRIVPLSGLVVTKLDGSARAGIVVALANRFKLPIFAIGVGEGADDFQPFHAGDFAKVLMGL
jgi:fused signal recognition particle receptor